MFDKSAALYDAIYRFKNYAAEADMVRELVYARAPRARTLLDVACGTGKHLEYLRNFYEAEGLDADPALLGIAAQRNPGMPLHVGDMSDFDLGPRFDVVTCLFSGIGYMQTEDRMRRAVATMAAHLRPGGVLVIEPWLSREEWDEGLLGAVFVDDPDLKVARFNGSRVENGCSIMEMHYLVTTREGTEHFTETHSLGLFTPEQYQRALADCLLRAEHDPEGLTGRGLHIGVKPADA